MRPILLIDFKGPNPADWCARGYAICDIDARGCGHSEGNLMFWGEQVGLPLHTCAY